MVLLYTPFYVFCKQIIHGTEIIIYKKEVFYAIFVELCRKVKRADV